MKGNVFKSIGAVLAGMSLIVVFSVATDALLRAANIFPPLTGPYPAWMLALAIFYRSVFGVAGGYLAAALAPEQAMRHAIILGAVGMVANLVSTLANWNMPAHWYPIMLVTTSLPTTWLGGKIKSGNSKSIVYQ